MREIPIWIVSCCFIFPVPKNVALTCFSIPATHEPEGILFRESPEYAPGAANSARINATLLALVRNEELPGMLQSMKDLERTWNRKFNYPWTFFNDVPFSEEFKKQTSAATKAECRYGMECPNFIVESWY